MPSVLTSLLVGCVVFVTHFVQGVTGFGCAMLAMPFCIMLLGLDVARPVLTVLALILDIALLATSWNHIDRRRYLHILAWVLPGLPVGMIAYNVMPQAVLVRVFAGFMLIVGIQGLAAQARAGTEARRWPQWFLHVLLLAGGAAQGAFTSGGPPVVIYATQTIPGKSPFRAALVAIWTTLNVFIVADIVRTHALTGTPGRLVLICLPFLAAGASLGEAVHRRISGQRFMTLVYIMLLVSAVFTAL